MHLYASIQKYKTKYGYVREVNNLRGEPGLCNAS